MDFGKLTPILCEPILPSDRWRVGFEALVRLQPMLAPIMHRVNVYVHWFNVPLRLIWDDSQKFLTGGVTGDDLVNLPCFTSDAENTITVAEGSLGDYLGLSTGIFKGRISQLPFRAYQLIYNEYYRDQNLQEEIPIPKDSIDVLWQDEATGIPEALQTLRTRNWEKDYFTSALPWAQRGEAVRLPLQGTAPVVGDPYVNFSTTGSPAPNKTLKTDGSGRLTDGDMTPKNVEFTGLETDLSQATQTTITDLRRGYAMQRFKEKMARGGSRYTEYLKFIFGQRSSDARLQRPEFLGGGKLPVRIAEVFQTSATQEDSAQGNMAGHGVMAGSVSGFNRKFEEHGYLIGIMSIMPRTGYVQGTRRHFMHTDRFDFPVPDFAHIGEQPVWLAEITPWTTDIEYDPKAVFGYQRRFAEHTVIPDTVHGDMKTSLDFWHMARKFDNEPQLSEEFVQFDPSVVRSFADVNSDSKIIVQSYANIQAIRPIPKWGEPI